MNDAQKQLEMIHEMMNKSQREFQSASFYYLFWGWLVFISALVHYLLLTQTNFTHPYAVWATMPIAGIISGIYAAKQQKSSKVKTYIDEAIGSLWLIVAFAFFGLIAMAPALGIDKVYPFLILLYGIGTATTGKITGFKLLYISGLLTFPLAVASAYMNFDNQLLVLALAIFISYIIPGHLLKKKELQMANSDA
ncbi:MAG: hypothetical protein LAT68_01215 [Cyclobacteriaceae bacterium]|nr:hypothetical protein [Cyclobacteriaceae bacterium]MCH8514922.1 hypothetical protein [Cyclobacteriaceae bacterium]